MARLRQFIFWSTAALLLVAISLLVVEYRINKRSRLELAQQRPKTGRDALLLANKGTDAVDRATKVAPGGDQIAKENIEAMLLRVVQDHLYRTNDREVRRLFGLINAKDMPYAMEVIGRLPSGETRSQLRMELLMAWARLDPAAAASSLAMFSPSESRQAHEIVTDLWAEKDPEAALAFAGPTNTVLKNLASKFPEEAVRVALQFPKNSNDRAGAIGTVSEAWFKVDPSAAWEWASQLGGDDRFFGVRPLISEMAGIDPGAVGAFIAEQPAQSNFYHLVANFTQQWAGNDPKAAATWAVSLPSSSALRAEAVAGVVQTWARDDPTAAAAWISTLTGNVEQDIAVARYVETVVSYDPAAAAQMAITAPSEDLRANEIADTPDSTTEQNRGTGARVLMTPMICFFASDCEKTQRAMRESD